VVVQRRGLGWWLWRAEALTLGGIWGVGERKDKYVDKIRCLAVDSSRVRFCMVGPGDGPVALEGLGQS
jgi:hypothetical protein